MNFIDRNKELGRLEAALKGCKGKLLVVYGRRRLGKSRLIKRILKEGDVYYEATKSESSTQRLGLAASVALLYNDFDKPTYSTWDSLLSAFNNLCKEGATLMLDEFPYLVERDSSLPSVIQTIVDSGTMRYNLLICGSSQRMMQKLVLDGSEPLYGRASEKINLGPIRAQYWWHALNLSAKQVVEEYSVWGGVPRYWVLREQYSSLDDALENLILDEHGPLAEEPEALFLDDTNVIAPYISIMSAIGQGNAKFSRIADVVGHKVSELAPVMKNLIAMHYVRKEVPFGEDVEKSKKTLYVIDDPFLDFYYRFVVPARPLLSMDRTDVVLQNIHSHMAEHVGHIWERLCQIAVSGNNVFGHTWNVAAHWWGKVPVFKDGRKTPTGNRELEFDVVAESMDDKNTILVGECKWKSADHAERLLAQLQEKVKYTPFAKSKKIVYALFLREKPLSAADCEIMLPEDVLNNLPK